ncbi:hypothetical protein ACFQZZ_33080 [Nocardia sp. GCM10030253]|uniref:hypothetical protein n=1 Tax=Nocardia sp. GCM10030253 TaxID=3273404 RepID=UPI00364144C2
MSLKSGPVQQFSIRAGAVAMATADTLVGFTGPANSTRTDPAVQFTPTPTRIPGDNCAAIINAETVPQAQSGQFGVWVKITQTGQLCWPYRVAVRWRNLDSGYSDGQVAPRRRNGVINAPDGVITGMGMAPGTGNVEAWIDTTYEDHREMEHIAGRVTLALG